MLNLSILLEQGAKRHPEKPAISYENISLGYKQTHEKVCQAAQAFQRLGVKPGDNVALLCPNIPQYIIAFFGILKLGATVVPLNILLKTDEIAYHLEDSASTLFLCFSGTETLPMGKYGKEAFDKTDSCKHMIGIGFIHKDIPVFDELLGQEDKSDFESYPTSSEDTAVIIYTSGTTGKPKGAELSHINLFSNADISVEIVGSKELETQLVVLPLFHIFGLTVMMLAGLRKALHLILLPRFDAKQVYKLIAKHKINIFAGVPSMYWALLQEEDNAENRDAIAHLRIAISGGASLPVKIIDDFKSRFDVPIIEGYGMSEGSPVVTFNQMDIGRKPGSIGTPIWGVDVKIVDEDGNEVPIDTKGELIYRGPNVMKAYFRRPEETEEVLKNGWLYSGDIATKDGDGFFYIVDRKKEMIVRGGMNVYPREVEEVMMKHPQISMVAIIGIPDDKMGEEIKAFVVKKTAADAVSEEDIREWTKARVAPYKYPRHIAFVAELPLSASGKILKKLLKTD